MTTGMYRAVVVSNADPLGQKRLLLTIPAITGANQVWADPCIPIAGFAMPAIGAGVWVEFEGGDVQKPVWTGMFGPLAPSTIAPGATGPAGPTGPAGSTWYEGSGAPSGATGVVGDYYLNTANGDVYTKTGVSTWGLTGNIKGLTGATGPTGSTGATGPAGSTWYEAAGAPATGTGVVGDYYLNTTNGDVYTKTGVSTWTLAGNIKGPTGPTGPTGPAGSATPSGVLAMFGGSTIPTGWLLCDGTAVSRTTYAALFTAISTTYGVGDGSTTFNLPNLKGSVAVGLDAAQTEFNALGKTGGAKTHTIAATELPAHTHGMSAHTHTGTSGGRSAAHTHADTITDGAGSHQHGATYLAGASGTATSWVRTAGSTGTVGGFTGAAAGGHNHGINLATESADHSHTTTTGGPSVANTDNGTGGGAAMTLLQPYVTVNYIIAV